MASWYKDAYVQRQKAFRVYWDAERERRILDVLRRNRDSVEAMNRRWLDTHPLEPNVPRFHRPSYSFRDVPNPAYLANRSQWIQKQKILAFKKRALALKEKEYQKRYSEYQEDFDDYTPLSFLPTDVQDRINSFI